MSSNRAGDEGVVTVTIGTLKNFIGHISNVVLELDNDNDYLSTNKGLALLRIKELFAIGSSLKFNVQRQSWEIDFVTFI